MKITNEIKAKVFAQYIFNPCVITMSETKGIVETIVIGLIQKGEGHFKLILKPLSTITDEDAIEVAKIMASPHIAMRLEKDDTRIRDAKYWIRNGLIATFNCNGYKALEAFQFLQLKGYDLPNYLLGGKTLNEAGLAIYENEN